MASRRDQRGFGLPSGGKPANQSIDLTVPGTGTPVQDHGAEQLDNRSAAHYGRLFPGKEISALPPSGKRQQE